MTLGTTNDALVHDLEDGCGFDRIQAVAIMEAICFAARSTEFAVASGTLLQDALKSIAHIKE